ncbi:MAG: hypothetical protein LBV30_03130 [Propionibacteriaceae bacterium]|jgi:hypothetical protein|nr:hypothetical protein [Propionibacteriaceae bacterium]
MIKQTVLRNLSVVTACAGVCVFGGGLVIRFSTTETGMPERIAAGYWLAAAVTALIAIIAALIVRTGSRLGEAAMVAANGVLIFVAAVGSSDLLGSPVSRVMCIVGAIAGLAITSWVLAFGRAGRPRPASK